MFCSQVYTLELRGPVAFPTNRNFAVGLYVGALWEWEITTLDFIT